MGTTHKFDAEVYEWQSKAAWFFVNVPADLSEELEARFGGLTAGFGSLKVEVNVGQTTWTTSIFPGKSNGVLEYALPLKKAVRKAEGLDPGVTAAFKIKILVAS